MVKRKSDSNSETIISKFKIIGMMIQSEVHDSIEDARTALHLYRKYEELQTSGKLQAALEELYETGKKVQWKVPNADSSLSGTKKRSDSGEP